MTGTSSSMLQQTRNKLLALRHRHRVGTEFWRYLQGEREVCCNAPYPMRIYQDLLDLLVRDSDVTLQDYTSRDSGIDRIHAYVRHDIDTLRCIENMPFMLDINLKVGVQAGVFFLVDDEHYRLADYRELILRYREAGVEVGLHTQCYVDDDPLAGFRRETDVFTESLGFAPSTFTIHGLGSFRADVRTAFRRKISRQYGDFGYVFSDAINAHRRYHHVIQDCHGSEESGGRYIYDDFIRSPGSLRKPSHVLVLTHPCYWDPSGPGEDDGKA